MENTIYQSLFGTGEETTIRVQKKATLKKALQKVFGDNAYCYLDQAINTGYCFELTLYNKAAIDIFNNL